MTKLVQKIRFRLRSLFAIMAIISVIAAAIGSHYRAFDKIKKIHREVRSSIREVQPILVGELRSQLATDLQSNQSYLNYSQRYASEDAQPLLDALIDIEGLNQIAAVKKGGIWSGASEIESVFYVVVPSLDTDFSQFFNTRKRTVDPKVHVVIRCYSPWKFFAGTPRVTIVDLGHQQNKRLIELLSKELVEKNIPFEVTTELLQNAKSSPIAQ